MFWFVLVARVSVSSQPVGRIVLESTGPFSGMLAGPRYCQLKVHSNKNEKVNTQKNYANKKSGIHKNVFYGC